MGVIHPSSKVDIQLRTLQGTLAVQQVYGESRRADPRLIYHIAAL